ncbi:MAG: hypothetical protein KGJ55_09435 [Gammaproteobacteria bacterium]|nr:hypothetical protein [Gammaproteobacteria bacterium]
MRKPLCLSPRILFAALLVVTAATYWPGLYGGFIFDDYPNIVDNPGLQPKDASFRSLAAAALSSPASEFKRPLASLSFALNYLAAGGLDPFWMKLTNLVIHLLNGALFYWLAALLLASRRGTGPPTDDERVLAALITGGWLLLPINLTGVIYVVQRMESLANVFVVLGLLGYVAGRRRSLRGERGGLPLAAFSLIAASGIGFLAKETAAMTPLYAALIELFLLGFRRTDGRRDAGVLTLFSALLVLPLLGGLAWQLPQVLKPSAWTARGFTLGQRLMTEPRVVLDYLRWSLLPTPHALSFYHDDYRASTGWLTPWTTLPSALGVLALVAAIAWLRKRAPLVALGLALFLGCQLLTATILPLELVYEHRNYFASFSLMLALVPVLATAGTPLAFARRLLLAGLMIVWTAQTAITAYAWGSPLRLSEELARRAPDSPRAQYDLGRTYIILSHYDPQSKFTRAAYAPLERAMRLPGSSILPEQALIFMNSRMNLPQKPAWWQTMTDHLRDNPVTVQDESSLEALAKCADDGECKIAPAQMTQAFLAALSHSPPDVRVLTSYANYAQITLHDLALAERLLADAVTHAPNVLGYRVSYADVLIQRRHFEQARAQLDALRRHDIADIYAAQIQTLQQRLPAASAPAPGRTAGY